MQCHEHEEITMIASCNDNNPSNDIFLAQVVSFGGGLGLSVAIFGSGGCAPQFQ